MYCVQYTTSQHGDTEQVPYHPADQGDVPSWRILLFGPVTEACFCTTMHTPGGGTVPLVISFLVPHPIFTIMTFKTKPLAHQLAELEQHGDDPLRCLWWDMGTGKSKACIDLAAKLWRERKINGMLVLAPGGVETQWALDEIPMHMPEDVPVRILAWETGRMRTSRAQQAAKELLEHGGLSILCVSHDGIMTERKSRDKQRWRFFGAELARAFLEKRRCLYVLDEGSVIKNAGNKTSKRIMASAKYAPYRRLLEGTPVDDSPMHAYAQVKWADPNHWARLGIHDFSSFKVFFGEWEQKERKDGRTFPNLVRYRNLDTLRKVVSDVGTRVLKSEVLDLPEKVYQASRFDLSEAQQKLYDQLREEYVASFSDGEQLEAELAIQRTVRLQQVCSNYLPVGDEPTPRRITEDCPRLACLSRVLDTHDGQGIIFGKYEPDILFISSLLDDRGESFVRYDGTVSPEQRRKSVEDFQAGRARWFLAKQSAAGRGLTLTAASMVVFYDNLFSLSTRNQAESRAHRHGQTRTVKVVDIVARGTIDEHILAVLRSKRDVAAKVTGDEAKSWA